MSDEVKFTYDGYTHTDGRQCIWVDTYWFVPLDVGGEGYVCERVHHVAGETRV